MPCSSVECEPLDEPEPQEPEPEQPECEPEWRELGGPLTQEVFRALFLGELMALFHTLRVAARASPVPHLFQVLQFEDFVALAHRSS